MSETPKAPIRLSLRTYTADEIVALNSDPWRRGKVAFRPAEDVIWDLKSWRNPTREEALGWYFHPDERVHLALLENRNRTSYPASADNHWLGLITVWANAYAQALREGVEWTPVLDYIVAERRFWPSSFEAKRLLSLRNFLDQLPYQPREPLQYRDLYDHAEALRDWVKEGEWERIEPVLEIRSESFLSTVLACVDTMTPTLLRRILARQPDTGVGFADRIQMYPRRVREAIKKWAFEDLLRAQERVKNPSPYGSGRDRRELAYGAQALERIANAGPSPTRCGLSPADIDRLFGLLGTGGIRGIGPSDAAARVLLGCARYLDEDQLMRLLPHLASEPADLLRLVSAAVYATPRVWKACLDLVPTGAMEDAISRQPQAVKSPEIRALLGRSKRAGVLERVIREASDEEFPYLFRRLCRRNPDAAAWVLNDQPERARLLTRTDLLPLVQSKNQRNRLAAIIALGEMTAARNPSRERRRHA